MDNKTKQAMQMALEALEKMAHPCNEKRVFDLACEVIPALREALAQDDIDSLNRESRLPKRFTKFDGDTML